MMSEGAPESKSKFDTCYLQGMSLSDIVDISITADSTTVSRAGFGLPVIMSFHQRFADEYRIYTSLSELYADGFRSYDDAYRVAAAVFSSEPCPTSVIVGRLAAAPSFVTKIQAVSATEGKTSYLSYLEPQSGAEVEIERTIPAASTLGAEATALAAAVNAVDVDSIVATLASTAGIQNLSGTALDGVFGDEAISPARRITFTFSSHADWDATNITLNGLDAAGAVVSETIAVPNGGNATVTSTGLFSLVTGITVPAQSGTGGTATVGTRSGVTATVTDTVYVTLAPLTAGRKVHAYDLVHFTQEETTAAAGYDTALAELQLENDDWYFVLIDSESEANVDAVAAWTLTQIKLFFTATASAAELTSAGTLCAGLNQASNGRTVVLHCPNSHEFGGARWVGFGAAYDPGDINWGHSRLAGLTGKRLTTTQKSYLEGDKGNHYQPRNGVSVALPGNLSDGEWIDTRHGLDALMSDIQETVFELFVNSLKVPYTEAGLDLVGAHILSAMKRFEGTKDQPGLIAEGTSRVIMPVFSTISSSDKNARRLRGIRVSGTLEGAINYVTITGTLSF